MEKRIITRKEITECVNNNDVNVKFANRSLNKRLAKNRKAAERAMNLRNNLRAKEQRMQKLQNQQNKMDVATVKNMGDDTDKDLISAVIGIGLTAADMIDCGVDPVRALRIVKEAEQLLLKHASNKQIQHLVDTGAVAIDEFKKYASN